MRDKAAQVSLGQRQHPWKAISPSAAAADALHHQRCAGERRAQIFKQSHDNNSGRPAWPVAYSVTVSSCHAIQLLWPHLWIQLELCVYAKPRSEVEWMSVNCPKPHRIPFLLAGRDGLVILLKSSISSFSFRPFCSTKSCTNSCCNRGLPRPTQLQYVADLSDPPTVPFCYHQPSGVPPVKMTLTTVANRAFPVVMSAQGPGMTCQTTWQSAESLSIFR